MIDKIKDFLYDISDVFFSILIIVVIFLVVTWKISSSMSFDLLPTYFSSSEDSQKELSEVKVIRDSPATTDGTDPVTDSTTSTTDPGSETAEGDTTDANPTDPSDAQGNDNSTVKVIEDIKITVAPGSTGHSIAKQLVDNNLVADITTFNTKVEEMGLGGKLQSGNFTLSTGDTLADMVRVLCSKSREDN